MEAATLSEARVYVGTYGKLQQRFIVRGMA